MISSSNFVAIARLVILARKDPGTTSLFSSLLHPVTLTCTLFSRRAFLRNVNIRKETSIGTCPTSFVLGRVSMRFESVARVQVMGVDCIHVYPFYKIFLLFWVLEFSVYSVFCFRIFCKFRVLVYSVYSIFHNIPCIPPFRSIFPSVRKFLQIGSPHSQRRFLAQHSVAALL